MRIWNKAIGPALVSERRGEAALLSEWSPDLQSRLEASALFFFMAGFSTSFRSLLSGHLTQPPWPPL